MRTFLGALSRFSGVFERRCKSTNLTLKKGNRLALRVVRLLSDFFTFVVEKFYDDGAQIRLQVFLDAAFDDSAIEKSAHSLFELDEPGVGHRELIGANDPLALFLQEPLSAFELALEVLRLGLEIRFLRFEILEARVKDFFGFFLELLAIPFVPLALAPLDSLGNSFFNEPRDFRHRKNLHLGVLSREIGRSNLLGVLEEVDAQLVCPGGAGGCLF